MENGKNKKRRMAMKQQEIATLRYFYSDTAFYIVYSIPNPTSVRDRLACSGNPAMQQKEVISY
jgi:hypothetical protein